MSEKKQELKIHMEAPGLSEIQGASGRLENEQKEPAGHSLAMEARGQSEAKQV